MCFHSYLSFNTSEDSKVTAQQAGAGRFTLLIDCEDFLHRVNTATERKATGYRYCGHDCCFFFVRIQLDNNFLKIDLILVDLFTHFI